MEFSRTLPFPRGNTYSDGGLVSLAVQSENDGAASEASSGKYPGEELCGQIYTVPDTVHGLHSFVRLRVVRNHATTSLTVARKVLAFNTGAAEHGKYVKVITAGTGVVGKPFDDAYTVGKTIVYNDLFYVVDEGPCDILVTASQTDAAAMALGTVVTPMANGVLYKSAPAASQYQLGVLDEDPATAATAYRVFVKSGLMAQEA